MSEDVGDGAVGDQPLLVELRGAKLGELAQAGDAGAQLELGVGSQAERLGVFRLRIPGDHGGIDGVGLLQRTHALGKLPDGARVYDSHGEILLRKLSKGLLLIAAGGFHGDQFGLMGVAEGGQCVDALRVVGEGGGGAMLADARLQGLGSNIHSTNDSCHGNLPCKCDRNRATVRSYVTWAAVPVLSAGR